MKSLKQIGRDISYNKRKTIDGILQVERCLSRQIVKENIKKLDNMSQMKTKRLLVDVAFY